MALPRTPRPPNPDQFARAESNFPSVRWMKSRAPAAVAAVLCVAVLFAATPAGAEYLVSTIPAGSDTEHHLSRDGFHFGSVIVTPNGAVIFRPHPDQGDVNGWGTSYYVNPFLSGAEPSAGAVVTDVPPAGGIDVTVTGSIARAPAGVYGTFSWLARLSYDPATEMITGAGSLVVDLDGTLAGASADLNLDRFASNILTNVPLQTGGVGTTGDMSIAHVSYAPAGDPRDFDWFPPDPPYSHFPQDFSDFLSIEVVGDVNVVDTEALGEGFQIDIAHKPTLSVSLQSQSTGDLMIFGGVFDAAVSQDFSADNVGINHLVPQGATDDTSLAFDLQLQSVPIPEPATPGDTNADHIVDDSDLANLVAQFGGPPGDESADFNEDGRVDLTDFAIMRGNFGSGVPSAPDAEFGASVPEPATLSLLALLALSLPKRGGLVMLRRRRNREDRA